MTYHKFHTNMDTYLLLTPNGSRKEIQNTDSNLMITPNGPRKGARSVDPYLLLTPTGPRKEGRRCRNPSASSRHALSARRGSSYQEYVNIFDKAFADALKAKDDKGGKARNEEEDDNDNRLAYLVVYIIVFFGVLLLDKKALLNYVSSGCLFCRVCVCIAVIVSVIENRPRDTSNTPMDVPSPK